VGVGVVLPPVGIADARFVNAAVEDVIVDGRAEVDHELDTDADADTDDVDDGDATEDEAVGLVVLAAVLVGGINAAAGMTVVRVPCTFVGCLSTMQKHAQRDLSGFDVKHH
jgi:hypothetical protein